MTSKKLSLKLPILEWLPTYHTKDLPGDLLAGIVVTIVLIPQAMAYAMLAGLPPQLGLYSCVLPIVIYALLGSSRLIAIGPVGLMSLMTATALAELPDDIGFNTTALALNLALLTGACLLLMRLIRLGSVINFLSHPVISGFTSASALLIALSQLRHLLGIPPATVSGPLAMLEFSMRQSDQINPHTTLMGIGSLILMLAIKGPLYQLLAKTRFPAGLAQATSRSGPLVAVIIGTSSSALLKLESYGVAVVGHIPSGMPPLTLPPFEPELWWTLLPSAAVIAMIGFLESVSVGKALASRKRQKIDANQELIGLGSANLGAALAGGYPVAGGFGRSMVNYAAGANTPLAALITAFLMALALLHVTPWLYHLPRAVLAAIIMIAVSGLIDLKTLHHTWRYNRADTLSLMSTFLAVLSIGLEAGILIGAGLSIALYLQRSSQPHIAILGRIKDSEHFRNVERQQVETYPHILLVRVDENLYFANTNFLEDKLMNLVVEQQQVKHLVLVCSAINYIDMSALEALETIAHRLQNAGVSLSLAEIKGPVMDKLRNTGFIQQLGRDRVFLSTHEAVQTLQSD